MIKSKRRRMKIIISKMIINLKYYQERIEYFLGNSRWKKNQEEVYLNNNLIREINIIGTTFR